jgi:DegV family protein with EDD domain
MAIAVVTDSTACLPKYVVERDHISVVPVQVTIDDTTRDEGVELSSLAVLSALNTGKNVTTNHPSPQTFQNLFSALQMQGYSEVIAIHLSSELSATYAACVTAARESAIPVRVVDSRTIGLGLGFAVMAASAAVKRGVAINEVAEIAVNKGKSAKTWLAVETVDHLRKGGRIGTAQAIVGTALGIKPILEIMSGKVIPFDKVRTSLRVNSRLVELAVEVAEHIGKVEIGVQHSGSRDRADALAKEIGKALPGTSVVVAELGAVLSAHAGPGAVAVTVSPIANH